MILVKKLLAGFLIGVFLGSLLFVYGFPNNGSKILTSPLAPSLSVSKVKFPNSTAFLITGRGGVALNPQLLTDELKVISSKFGEKTHILAIPVNEKGTAIVGYGIRFFSDGRIAVKVIRAPVSKLNLISPNMVVENLKSWVRKKPYFHPDIRATPMGVPKGYKVKTLNVKTGEEHTVLRTSSEPYWHDFGPVEDQLIDPPYGNIYMVYHVWGLRNDGNPNREWIAVAGDGTTGLANSYYRIEPGIELRNYFGDKEYKSFKTKEAVISHKWDLDSSLSPVLGAVNPTTMPGEETLTMGVGAEGASISYTVVIPDEEIISYTDGVNPQADWVLKFNTDSECAKTTFSTMVGSVASFNQKVLQDGKWHKIVEVDFKVTFERSYTEYLIIQKTEDHTVSMGMVWLLKVGS